MAAMPGEERGGGVLGRGEGEKRGILESISAVSSCEGTNASSCARLRLAGGLDFAFGPTCVIDPIFEASITFTGVAILVTATGGVVDPIFISASASSSLSRPNDPIWILAIGARICCVGESA